MAITIRELLASDTISQAADKINFNFDQLLLNGGGPLGPNGPQGPPGPIGGRGIRGSVWYEGSANPNTTPPTLTPEDEDNYLQSNGDVWSYNESTLSWVLTGINLEGPTGPAGTGGKFDEYQASPYIAAGDTTIFPGQMTLSSTAANESTRSVLIGGGPAGIAGFPLTGNEVVPSSIAQNLEKPSYTMMLHQFDSNDTALVFHGGDSSVGQWYEQNNITQLSSIKLVQDDALRIVVPKALSLGNTQYPGIYMEATERALDFNAGTEIKFRTGTSPTATSYAGANNFDVSVNDGSANPTPFARIRADYGSGEAEFRVGTTVTPATGTAYPGTIYGYGGKISLIGSDDMNLRSSGIIDIIGSGNVRLWSSNGTMDVFASDLIDIHSRFNNVHIFTATGSGGDIFIDTDNTGSEIKIETSNTTSPITIDTTGATSPITLRTDDTASPIELTTNTANSPIVLDANNGGVIPSNINQGGTVAYSLLRSQGNFYIGAGTGSYSFPGFFPSGNKIVLDAQDDIILQAAEDIILKHGSGDEVLLQPTSGGALMEFKPASGDDTSTINLYHNSGGGPTNLMLSSNDNNDRGEIAVSDGMSLELSSGSNTGDQVIIDGRGGQNAENPGVSINGDNHTGTQTLTFNTGADVDILTSGTWNTAGCDYNWTRVGNVVNIMGKVTGNSLPGWTGVYYGSIPVPIGDGSAPSNVRGHGQELAPADPPTSVYASADGGNTFKLEELQDSGVLTGSSAYFVMSYTI